MIAKIISFAHQKGGTGKTTLTMQLAGTLGKQEQKVLVIDTDPQATAIRWANSAPKPQPFPAEVIQFNNLGATVHQEIQQFLNDYDYILIDCPPAISSEAAQSALLVSDLVLIPLIPSPPDLWASVGIRTLINNATKINQTLQARLVVNQCQVRTTLAREILEILAEFQIEMLKTNLRQRTVYRQSAVFGKTVHDFRSRAKMAIEEFNALTDEILVLLT